jgi:hypothetical protein
MSVVTSVSGTNRTSGDVRSSVAIGGKAEVTRAAHFGRKWPKTDIPTSGPSRAA